MLKFCRTFFSLVVVMAATQAFGQGLFTPGDPILGGRSDGTNFVVGVAGTAAGQNNWPANESPDHIIDGVGQKYLNFAEFNTGVIVTPSVGPTNITAAQFWPANDAEPRDPTGYAIYGTNSPVSGPSIPLSNFTLIAQGNMTLPSARIGGGATPLIEFDPNISVVAGFDNSAAYTSYMILFPDVKNSASANSMQIAEVQVYGAVVPEPAAGFLGLTLFGLLLKLRRR